MNDLPASDPRQAVLAALGFPHETRIVEEVKRGLSEIEVYLASPDND